VDTLEDVIADMMTRPRLSTLEKASLDLRKAGEAFRAQHKARKTAQIQSVIGAQLLARKGAN
jgi:hypothetical protein